MQWFRNLRIFHKLIVGFLLAGLFTAAVGTYSGFRMQQLNDFFYSWGATAGDINHDGIPDVVAGPFYFLGPAPDRFVVHARKQ